MPYDVGPVANYILTLASERNLPITHLKLQKLLYFAHGWHLGLHGDPLIKEPFQAWDHGPVNSTVYHQLKSFGSKPVNKAVVIDKNGDARIIAQDSETTAYDRRLINRILDTYGVNDPLELSAKTYEPDAPWAETRKLMTGTWDRQIEIDDDLIKEYFEKRAKRPK